MKIERYHIRVDDLGRTLEFLKDWLKKHDIKTYCISKEYGTLTNKLHYQGFVDIDLDIRTEKAWRENLKSHLHTNGRNQYSLTLKHGNIETYICKDGDIILKSDDIHPLQIEEWIKNSYKKIQDKKPVNSFTVKYLDAMSNIINKDRTTLTFETIKYFRDNTKIFDKFIIKRFVYLALVTLNESSDRVIERLVDSFWDD